MLSLLSQIRLRTRVLAAFALVMSLMLVAALIGMWRTSQLNDRIDRLVSNDVQALELSRVWAGLTEANIQRRVVQMTSDDTEFVKAFTRRSKETSERIDQVQKELDALSMSPASDRLKDDIDRTRKQYQNLRTELVKAKEGGADTKPRIVAELIPAMERYLATIQAYADNARSELQTARREAEVQARTTHEVIIGLLVAATVLGGMIALAITRSVAVPIKNAVDFSARIAGGDLTARLAVDGKDELADLAASLKEMQSRLARTIEGVRDVAHHVHQASSEIAAGNQDLSNRTEQAASNLEQTGAAVHTLRDGVAVNATAVQQADSLAKGASEVAAKGGELVSQVVKTMDEIQSASNRIQNIIQVIDGIAFQTNILALNAAVEAARAGEEGRGFAVVASEVRNLAGRSAGAAKEIKTLIGASVDRVEAGNKLVCQAGSTISEIVDSVQLVTTIVSEISGATQSQADTITEVDQAVRHLDTMTQQNASLVEQSAAAAESLRQQAQQLVACIDGFKLESKFG